MGAREDFDQALHRGDFAAAARVWAMGNLHGDEGVQLFEAKLAASLEDREYVPGGALTLADGEYSYLGNNGKDGARLAYLANNSSLDNITYLHNHDDVVAHLLNTGASQLDSETVVAFFAVSERQSYELSQQAEQAPVPQERAAAAPALTPAVKAPALSPEDAIRALISQSSVDSPEVAEAMVAIAKRDFKTDRVHVGNLYAYGRAPYKNDPRNAQNFFVSFVRPDGQEETVWGKELESALAIAELDTGAAVDIVLSHQGMETVTVRVPELDAQGARTGNYVDAPASRNQWKAVSLDQLRHQAKELLTEQAYDKHVAEQAAAALPAPVADIKKRMQNATWFFDTIEDEAARADGQQSLGQLREDFKALMIEYPEEAAEVWRSVAPAEYQPELADLLAQLENAAPEVIAAHKDHEAAEALQQESAVDHPGEDSIKAAPAVVAANEAEKEEDSIQPAIAVQGADKLKKQSMDAISRFAPGSVDAIANAGSSKKAEQKAAQAQQDASAGAPKTLLNGRFVLRDQGQYFRVADGVESTRVALVDEVSKIRFVDKQMDTFQAAIELAKYKQWEAILVTGSEKFRAEAWHRARMAGLEVVGYEPNEKELATLKAAQEGRAKVDHGKSAVAPAANPIDVDKAKSLKAAKDHAIGEGYGVSDAKTENGRHVGKIIHETDNHVVQDVGRKVAVVHDKDSFDKRALRTALENKKPLKIQYDKGHAEIEGSKERSQERGR